MGRKKKMRSSVKLTAIKRFEKSRSRRTCPAFQNTTFVFCGDWGGASTSTKLSVFAKWVPLCIACRFLSSVRRPSEAVVRNASLKVNG